MEEVDPWRALAAAQQAVASLRDQLAEAREEARSARETAIREALKKLGHKPVHKGMCLACQAYRKVESLLPPTPADKGVKKISRPDFMDEALNSGDGTYKP